MNEAQRNEICEFREDDIEELLNQATIGEVQARMDALDIGLELIKAYGADQAFMLGLAQGGNEERFRTQMEDILHGHDLSHLSLRGLVQLYDMIHNTALANQVNWQAADHPEHEGIDQ